MSHGPIRARSIASAVALALAAPAAGAAETTLLDEIVVTAQKRTESLQDVPVAVSAVSGEKLAEFGIVKIEDLRNYVPTLWMTETAIGNNIAIRGVFSGVNPGFEQSVGTYVDGIYRGRPQQTRMPFLDLDRVEVLRGPQSILFGKNSVAGALNITTARPTTEFEAQLSALYDWEYNEQEYTGVVSGPFTENFRGRLAARYRTTDGHFENLTLGNDEPNREEQAFRGWLEWDATEDLTVALKAERGEFDVKGRQIEIYFETPVPGAPSATNPFGGRTYAQILAGLGQPASVLNNFPDFKRSANGRPDNSGDSSDNETEEYVLSIDWRFGDGFTLTSTTGYSTYEFDELCDCDFTGGNVFVTPMAEEYDQTSQEFRLTSPTGGTFDYIVGAYYETADLEYRDSIEVAATSVLVPLLNARAPAGVLGNAIRDTGSPRVFQQDSTTWAAFAQGTWNVTEAFRATVGLRYTDEEKEATRNFRIATITGAPLTGSQAVLAPQVYAGVFNARAHSLAGDRSESKFLPSITLEYDFGDDIMTYLSWSQGAKSGGFDARSNNPTVPPAVACTSPGVPAGCLTPAQVGTFEFEDEESDNIELGAKMLLGGVFELNAAVFFTNFTDMQVSTFDGVLGFNVKNAGEADIQGLEIDWRWQATDHSRLSGAVAYTDFEFKDYFGQCAFGQPADAPDGLNCNYKGKTNQYVADWVATLAYDYRRPVFGDLEFRFGADAYYTTDTFVAPTLDPRQKQDGYTKLNARVALGAERWEVAILGRNLTDEDVYPYGNDTPLAGRTFNAFSTWRFGEPGRSFGVQGTLRF